MAKYIKFNADGFVERYDDSLHSNIPDDAKEIDDELFYRTINETDGIWSLVDDEVVKFPLPSETNEQIIARLEKAVDSYLDSESKSLRYESIKTIVSYRDDPNPKFKAEGIAGYQLRSAVYTSSIQLIEDVTKGLKEVPTESEFIASLPKITDFLQYE